MAFRPLLAVAAVFAAQALSGCGMPAKSGFVQDDRSVWRKNESRAREIRLGRKVEEGTLGIAQLYPGGMIEARHLPPLPRPKAIAIPVAFAGMASPADNPPNIVLAVNRPGGCTYKPIMSDADIDACR